MFIKVRSSYRSRSAKATESLTAPNLKWLVNLFTGSYIKLSLATA